MDKGLLYEIKIEPISEERIESFHQCLDSVARERLHLAFVEAPPLDTTRDFVLSNITRDVPQLVAVSGDEVVGWCDILPMSMEGFTHSGRLGMGVHKGFRKRGIGQRLVDQTIAEAKQQGIERIELEVFASNLPAISLYKKVGFEVEGVKKNARKLAGAYDDLVEMALFI